MNFSAVKGRLLPRGQQLRRLPVGIGRGLIVPIDFDRHTRLYAGLYEIELNGYLRRFCRPGTAAMDVGAQLGYDALVIAKLTGAPVWSFEADEALAAAMTTTFAANGPLRDLVRARHAYVGRRSDAENGVVALDDFVRDESFVPGIVKLDIDGGEVEALLGAERLLRETRPHMIIETHSLELERECGALLREAGYTPVVVNQRALLPDHRPTEHNRWLVAEGSPPAQASSR